MRPKHNDTDTGPNKSQKPTWNPPQKLISEKCETNMKRKINNPGKLNLIENHTNQIPGYDLPRKE